MAQHPAESQLTCRQAIVMAGVESVPRMAATKGGRTGIQLWDWLCSAVFSCAAETVFSFSGADRRRVVGKKGTETEYDQCRVSQRSRVKFDGLARRLWVALLRT